ncbi:MAG: hypothetical protein Q4A17_12710 [Thermoguttaceae bacterium]|nr:hypothetical protein [Thermoguttaceae bacterium]MDO4858792.1 hypothetical protein [Thermoguttaceae bacterium]
MARIQKKHWISSVLMLVVLGASLANAACPCFDGGCGNNGCFGSNRAKPAMPPYDRPFPLGHVSDAFWETQQTNAEAADFILYDYEFVETSATLTPMGRDHMTQIARRLPHVPFPIVIEMSEKTNDPKENRDLIQIDETRRANVVMWLQKFYADDPTMDPEQIANRVVIAPDFVYQVNAERAAHDFNNAMRAGRHHSGRGSGFGHGGYGYGY